MNGSTKNLIAVTAVAAAVIAGAVAYVMNGMSREAEARLLAEAKESEAAKAEAEKKSAKAAAEKAAAETPGRRPTPRRLRGLSRRARS